MDDLGDKPKQPVHIDNSQPVKMLKIDHTKKESAWLPGQIDNFQSAERAFVSNSRKQSQENDTQQKGIGSKFITKQRDELQHLMPQSRSYMSLEFDPEKDYKKEYLRIYIANVTIMDKNTQLKEENEALKKKITLYKSEKSSRQKAEELKEDDSLTNSESGSGSYSVGKRRKKRRKKEEIERAFKCSFKGCGKSYG